MNGENLQFDLITLASDSRFIAWVKNPNSKAGAYFNDWVSNHPDQADLVVAAREMVESIHIVEPAHDPNLKDRVWNNINTRISADIGSNQKKVVIHPILKWVSFAAAACVVFGLVFTLFFNQKSGDIYTGIAEHKTVTLPEHSNVFMNAGSRLTYDVNNFNEKNREMNLTGEAFFEVAKGSNFKVITPTGTVEVLGTSFNVRSRDGGLTVQCTTGKVRVANKNGSLKTILGPGDQIYTAGSDYRRSKFDATKTIPWRKGIIVFDNVALSQVGLALQRHYDVDIKIADEVQHLKYTGSFNTQELDKALHAVCWPMKLKHDLTREASRNNKKQITIKK